MTRNRIIAICTVTIAAALFAMWIVGVPPHRTREPGILDGALVSANLAGVTVDEYVLGEYIDKEALYRVSLTREDFDRLCVATRAAPRPDHAIPTRLVPYWWPKSQQAAYDVAASPYFDSDLAINGSHYLLLYDEGTQTCFIRLKYHF